MSVGAGSIKRAAKAANATEELNQAAGEAAAEKITAEKPATKKAAAKKTAAKKTTAKKKETPKESEQSASGKNKPAASAKYEAYGVGQELPVHLM